MSFIWSTVIFKENNEFQLLDQKPTNIIYHLGSKKIKTSINHPHTIADPFLLAHNNKLFLFAEIQRYKENGFINCWSTSDGLNWMDNGEILKKEFHLSFPFLFKSNGAIFMVPEQASSGKIELYKFQNFPYDPEPIVTITEESIDDPVLQFHSNLYFLLGTQGDMLKIYFSDDLFKNLWKEHPDSQNYKSKYVRNAGPILQLENKLLRFTQDCSEFYGNKIMVKEIVLDSKSYQEKIIDNDYSHNADNSFDNLGRHHISLAKFQGSTFIAMDGRTKDYKINKLLNFLIR